MNSVALKVLRFLHPKDERERMEFRYVIARAFAEVEDLERTLSNCTIEPKVKKPNGSGTGR